ncbi:protein phosphatase 2C family protein [Actinidia rufa]|uniref:Protein phosphatase 2C family protein n=1 Tax=Actinidia rufa TaxID=165716 RepID=A0A7J0G4E5_9ERIC|nr:protein phosphatase 2C family protein [Actinidia rufa]
MGLFAVSLTDHGPHGHLVARKVRDMLPLMLLSFLNSWRSGSSTSCFTGNHKTDRGNPQEGAEEEKAGSGSTAVTIVKQGSNLYMGSIGDSRAILGSKDSNETMVAIQLTIDLKPDLPSMFYRYMSGKLRELNGVKEGSLRWKMNPKCREFWLPFDDAPGLAMARAFGDFCLKEYGVISIPEFSHRTLTESDKFIVLASDGVWDVLSNEEVVEIVSSALTRSSAARLVVESAAREWKSKIPNFKNGRLRSATFRSNNGVESDDGHNSEPSLQRNFTVRSSEVNGENVVHDEDQNWSGLEGVTRVNSLVQLPRFSEEIPET